MSGPPAPERLTPQALRKMGYQMIGIRPKGAALCVGDILVSPAVIQVSVLDIVSAVGGNPKSYPSTDAAWRGKRRNASLHVSLQEIHPRPHVYEWKVSPHDSTLRDDLMGWSLWRYA